MKHRIAGTAVALALAAGAQTALAQDKAGGKPVVELTQVACQFLESEGGTNHGYKTARAEDCEAVNEKTAAGRLAKAKAITLAPGTYTFRVRNRDVPYELGFWLRGAGAAGRLKLPSVSGGGILPGGVREYRITLVPGEYVYSCPLNPTPDYPLIVK